MEEIKNLLETREKELLQMKAEKEKALRNAPNGSLRICSHGNRTQFYHRNDPKDFNGVYIREKDVSLAKRLAQKDYNQRTLRAIEKELNAIQNYRMNYPEVSAEQVYENLHKERQKLVTPILHPLDQYIQKWEAVEYHGRAFDENIPEFYTAKGERVRSKSEVIIADALYRNGIPYRYEYPLYFKNGGIVYPDFTILNVKSRREIRWEHLGMMDSEEYAERTVQKIRDYEENGFFAGENMIFTYETKKNPLNQKVIKRMIRKYLQ